MTDLPSMKTSTSSLTLVEAANARTKLQKKRVNKQKCQGVIVFCCCLVVELNNLPPVLRIVC